MQYLIVTPSVLANSGANGPIPNQLTLKGTTTGTSDSSSQDATFSVLAENEPGDKLRIGVNIKNGYPGTAIQRVDATRPGWWIDFGTGSNAFDVGVINAGNPNGLDLFTIGATGTGTLLMNRTSSLYNIAGGANRALIGSDASDECLIADASTTFTLMQSPVKFIAPFPSVTAYSNRGTAGAGLAAIFASFTTVGVAALQSNIINYTPPATAGTYRVSVFVNVRTAAAVNMTVTVTYKDGAGVARSETMPLNQQGTATTVINMNNTAARFTGQYIFQIDNSATAITVSTTGTTMTLYDLAVVLEQLG